MAWQWKVKDELPPIESQTPKNNRALYYIHRHTVVIFSITGSGEGRKCERILQEVRHKHKLPSELIIKIKLDPELAGSRRYMADLFKISGSTNLPQTFVNETLVGGYNNLKAAKGSGQLAVEMLKGAGFEEELSNSAARGGFNEALEERTGDYHVHLDDTAHPTHPNYGKTINKVVISSSHVPRMAGFIHTRRGKDGNPKPGPTYWGKHTHVKSIGMSSPWDGTLTRNDDPEGRNAGNMLRGVKNTNRGCLHH